MTRIEEDINAVFTAAVHGAQADRLLDRVHWDRLAARPLERYERVIVVGMGKASMAMAGHVERQLGDHVAGGLVVVPHGYPATLPARLKAPTIIDVAQAAHPVPDETNVAAATRILHLARRSGKETLFIVLLSGGGTALGSSFVSSVSLADAQAAFRLLLFGGADIAAMNAVRKHISRMGGGRLAEAAFPADVVAVAVSDVPGDDLSVIASGPTVPDPTTFNDAVRILDQFDLWRDTPDPVKRHLEAGAEGRIPDTPKPGSSIFERVSTTLIGNNESALQAAALEAERRGYRTNVVSTGLQGDARSVGRQLAERLLDHSEENATALLWGGETTVTVTGTGRGGRNQELALAAGMVLDRAEPRVALLSGGTDGIDGPTDAAGAWVTPDTAARARALGLDPERLLENNDAYTFFDALGQLLKPGPTHTNVMDIQIALKWPAQ